MPHLAESRSLLQWYLAMGVDETTSEQPTNWILYEKKEKETGKKPIEIQKKQPSFSPSDVQQIMGGTKTTQPTVSESFSSIIAEARQLADHAQDLESLKKAVLSFEGCSLKKMAKNTVFSDGNPESDVMLVGEAPGAEEDRQGIPFCGASGRLLDEMLGHIDLNREKSFYISNTLFWRPPGNRTPTPEETEICKPFVEKHIALINPKMLVLVGGTAAKSLLNENRGITRLRGQNFTYTNKYIEDVIPARVMFHPSYLLRQPLQKKLAWHDLLAIQEHMKTNQ